MEQQKEMLPGGHKLLSEYFQSCDRKQRYDEATYELLCSNFLSWFSWPAREEYQGNPPKVLVICHILLEYFAKYSSPAIKLLLCLLVSCLLLLGTVVLFTLFLSLLADICSPSLSQTVLWRQNLSFIERGVSKIFRKIMIR